MITRTLVLLATVATVATVAGAQSAPSATSQIRTNWKDMMANVTAAAEEVPDAIYAYKPTPEVRSFGAIMAHVAGSQRMFCAMALGDAPAAEDDIEKSATTKAAIVAALKASNDYCERAYAQSDAANAAMVDVFGTQRSRLFALMMNATHDAEHYGNVVTYMRLNRMVPPSSRPRP